MIRYLSIKEHFSTLFCSLLLKSTVYQYYSINNDFIHQQAKLFNEFKHVLLEVYEKDLMMSHKLIPYRVYLLVNKLPIEYIIYNYFQDMNAPSVSLISINCLLPKFCRYITFYPKQNTNITKAVICGQS